MIFHNLLYCLGLVISIPLFPFLYFQGKNIRSSVPKLPEATGNTGSAAFPSSSLPKIQLITLGESTIAGVGVDTHEEGFSGTLAKELSRLSQRTVSWKVYAKSGYTAKRVHEKLVPKIQESSPEIMVIGLGGNDAFTLNSPWQWRKDIQALIEQLHDKFPQAQLVFTNMPPIKEFPAFTRLIKFVVGNHVELLGKSLANLVKDYTYVTYYEDKISLALWMNKLALDAEESDFFSDGVHPSKLTYQTWAKDIAQRIVNDEIIPLKTLKT